MRPGSTVSGVPSAFVQKHQRSRIPGSQAGVYMSGVDDLLTQLLTLPDRVFRNVMTKASRRAMRPVVSAAKANAPRETGQLAKSIGVKVKKYPRKGVILTVVGPRSGFADAETGRNPVYYAHLQELGHKIVQRGSLKRHFSTKIRAWTKTKGSGRVIGFVKGIPFMKPALQNNQGAVLGILRYECYLGIEREAARGRAGVA